MPWKSEDSALSRLTVPRRRTIPNGSFSIPLASMSLAVTGAMAVSLSGVKRGSLSVDHREGVVAMGAIFT
jgi:hypothetical protein